MIEDQRGWGVKHFGWNFYIVPEWFWFWYYGRIWDALISFYMSTVLVSKSFIREVNWEVWDLKKTQNHWREENIMQKYYILSITMWPHHSEASSQLLSMAISVVVDVQRLRKEPSKRKTVQGWSQSLQFPASPVAAPALPGYPSCWAGLGGQWVTHRPWMCDIPHKPYFSV